MATEPQLRYQQKEFEEREQLPIHTLPNAAMIGLLGCKGVVERFPAVATPEDISFSKPTREYNPGTDAWYAVEKATIHDAKGKPYDLHISRDARSVVISVADSQTNQHVLKVGLRDRGMDGTPHATPPAFLRAFDGLPHESIPASSYEAGITNWHYATPHFDTPATGNNAVEISVLASDPELHILPPLTRKVEERRLWVQDAEAFAQFIDDPFASLPFDNPTPEALNNWYSMWWQVTSRILGDGEVPLPGQTSQRSFEGFLQHAVQQASRHLKESGYTHVDALLTWHYCWTKFQRLGFQPTSTSMHNVSESFFQTLEDLVLPHTTQDGRVQSSREYRYSKELISWLAVFPYALALQPDFTPQLPIPFTDQRQFHQVFQTLCSALKQTNGSIATYPLAPGRNLWYSLPL